MQTITTPSGDTITRKLAGNIQTGDTLYHDKTIVTNVEHDGHNMNITTRGGYGLYTHKNNSFYVYA